MTTNKHSSILNRLIDLTLRKSGPIILFEQDPGHVELVLEHLDFVKTKVKDVGTPDEKSGTCYDETDFEKSKVTLYRSCVMRFANLSADLSQTDWHEECTSPRYDSGSRLKRVARYWRTHGRWIQQHRRRESTSLIDTFADAIGRETKPIKNCILCSVSHPMANCNTIGISSLFK